MAARSGLVTDTAPRYALASSKGARHGPGATPHRFDLPDAVRHRALPQDGSRSEYDRDLSRARHRYPQIEPLWGRSLRWIDLDSRVRVQVQPQERLPLAPRRVS